MCATPSHVLTSLTDGELLAGLARLVSRNNEDTAALLAHMGEVDARRLYLPAGCSSMFAYCVRVLGLSEDATYKRIQAARAARRYPVIFDLIASGKLHLAGVTLLAPHLAPGNYRQLLDEAACLSKRDVERLVAHHFPSETAPAFVRRCPCTRLAPGQVECEARDSLAAAAQPATDPTSAPATYNIQFSGSEQLVEKLRAAQDLLGSSVPRGDLAQVFERALDALLLDLRRRKVGHADRPRSDPSRDRPPGQRSSAIAGEVQPAVAARDGEQSTFVDPASGAELIARTIVGADARPPPAPPADPPPILLEGAVAQPTAAGPQIP